MHLLTFERTRWCVLSGTLALSCAAACEVSAPADASEPHGGGGKADSFGSDDRTTVSESSDPRAVDWAASVAVLTARPIDRPVPTLEERFDLCEEELFLDEPFMGHCTAFLVGPALVATAAHCLDQHPCERTTAVFGINDVERNAPPNIDEASVFRCVGVHRNDSADVALVELDREVPRRAMTMGRAQEGQSVALVGHGLGSSSTVDLSGVVFSADETAVRSSLDTFSGHSGSPVVAMTTGAVVGIHIRGAGHSITHVADRQCHVFSECAPDIEGVDACLARASTPATLPFAAAGLPCPDGVCD